MGAWPHATGPHHHACIWPCYQSCPLGQEWDAEWIGKGGPGCCADGVADGVLRGKGRGIRIAIMRWRHATCMVKKKPARRHATCMVKEKPARQRYSASAGPRVGSCRSGGSSCRRPRRASCTAGCSSSAPRAPRRRPRPPARACTRGQGPALTRRGERGHERDCRSSSSRYGRGHAADGRRQVGTHEGGIAMRAVTLAPYYGHA